MTRRQLAIAGTVSVVVVAAAAAVAASPSRRGRAPPPAVFLGGTVTYSLPGRWRVQGLVADGAEGVAAYIPCSALDDTPHSANANLLAEPNGEGEGLASWSARRLAVAAPRRMDEERVERAWRTVVSTGFDRGARYAVVERFGVSPRGRVHAVAAFPVIDGVGGAWLARTGDEIDRFLGSIGLAGAAPSEVHVGWDGGTIRLAGPLAGAAVVSRPRSRRRPARRARRG